MNRRFQRILELLLVPIAAAIVFVEETLILYLNRATAALARWEPVARFEAWLKTLPPWAALLALVAPWLLLLPIKFATLWFLANGRVVLAFIAVVSGKVIGTAIIARFYRILRPTLILLPWFAHVDAWFWRWHDWLYAFVRALPAWQKTMEIVRRLRLRLKELVSGFFAR